MAMAAEFKGTISTGIEFPPGGCLKSKKVPVNAAAVSTYAAIQP
jgi:hypothetical protein